jgi:hypothetical protein
MGAALNIIKDKDTVYVIKKDNFKNTSRRKNLLLRTKCGNLLLKEMEVLLVDQKLLVSMELFRRAVVETTFGLCFDELVLKHKTLTM